MVKLWRAIRRYFAPEALLTLSLCMPFVICFFVAAGIHFSIARVFCIDGKSIWWHVDIPVFIAAFFAQWMLLTVTLWPANRGE